MRSNPTAQRSACGGRGKAGEGRSAAHALSWARPPADACAGRQATRVSRNRTGRWSLVGDARTKSGGMTWTSAPLRRRLGLVLRALGIRSENARSGSPHLRNALCITAAGFAAEKRQHPKARARAAISSRTGIIEGAPRAFRQRRQHFRRPAMDRRIAFGARGTRLFESDGLEQQRRSTRARQEGPWPRSFHDGQTLFHVSRS